MSDNGEDEEEVPVVELGDGPDVEGAPVSRVASRLFFPIEESEVLRREGETTVRTPDGPQTVADVLERSDEVYFETNADLVNTVRSVVGTGPVPTAGGGSDGSTESGGSRGTGGEDAGDSEAASETGTVEDAGAESEEAPAGAGESDDAEVAEDAETAESPGTEPEGDAETDTDDAEADEDADDEGEFEFDEE